jgi:hypothetical protein
MKPDDFIKAVLPGFIGGGVLYTISSFVGPISGPGWREILHGLSFFVGLIWVLIGYLRWARRAAGRSSTG